MICISKAQVSLEYLLLLGAFFSFLLLFFPLLQQTYYAGIFAFDVRAAQSFSDSFQSSVREFSVLGDGSKRILEASPATEWKIEAEKNILKIEIFQEKLKKKKEIKRELVHPVSPINFSAKKPFSVFFEKQDGKILIEHD